MIFSENFIRKPIMTTLVMVGLFIFGIASYFLLPISDLPSVDYPVMTISVTYPGASPATMASAVASPLENECMQIPGLQSVISDNTEGQTQIILTFDLDKNIDLAAPDVQAAISRAQSNLPGDLPQPPTYSKNNPSDTPIIYIMVTSDTMTYGDLYDYGNTIIGKHLSIISGVSQVATWGAKRAIRVQVDPVKLSSYKIGLDEVANVLEGGTVTIPAGSLNGPFRTFSIEPQGQLLKPHGYDELIVAYRDDAPIRIKDIGKTIDSLQNDVVNLSYGNKDRMQSGAICLAVYRQAGSNTVALSKKIKETLTELEMDMPGSMHMEIFYDKSDNIIESVNDVKMTIVIALILVVLVIFLFLGKLTETIIPSIVLPLSIVSTFTIMWAMGFSLDNLSLMGLTLSVGFLVDDAIVVLENTVRHVQNGEKALRAAINSMKEITGTVISTSIALVTVFVPLVFMSGVVGKNFREFALTVVFAIICSTFMALTVTPMMCGRMIKDLKDKKSRFEDIIDKTISGISSQYGVLLKWILHHKYISLLMWIGCILGSLWLFTALPKTFMPTGDSGAIMGQMVAPQGTSTDQIRKFQAQIDAILQSTPGVDKILSVTGLQPGADQTTGPFVVVLKDLKERQPIDDIVNELRVKFAGLSLGFVFIEAIPSLDLSAGGESTAAGSKYSYSLNANDREALYMAAQRFENALRKEPEFVDIQTSVKLNMPQLDINIFRDRASTLGLSAADIENNLRLAYSGGKVTTYKTDTDQYDVILELEKKYQDDPDNLGMIYIRSPITGGLVPLNSVASWTPTVGAQNVPHYDQLNSATISFNLGSNVPLGDATKKINEISSEIASPGISGTFQGEAQEFEEAISSLVVLLGVAIFIMYVVLGILYESYIHPFTVLTTLPPAAFGGLLTLFLFRSELSLYAYIGIFMLLGIVSKNGIMMVDFANQNMEEEDQKPFDAIHNACIVRFRPILMTGLSTIMGALPIALGYGADGASRRPLGLIIVGGLAFAQVVTLIITPGIFLYMQTIQDKYLNKFELTRSGTARKEEKDV
jgi:HAE1 family hydrophobic/amphiphilic exporter-1